MLRKALIASAALSLFAAPVAFAQVALTAVPGADPYVGPAPTYDFETGAPVSGGGIVTGTLSGQYAQPFGSTGNYWSIGPSTSSSGILDLSNFAQIGSVSFIWGSVDAYNTLEVLDRLGGVLATFTGAHAAVNPDGNQSNPVTNPVARLWFGDEATQINIGGLRLTSNQNAFEVDNFAVTAVPEPAVWAMLLLGFGFIGAFLRGQRRQQRLRLKMA
jgi:hypothetical protein